MQTPPSVGFIGWNTSGSSLVEALFFDVAKIKLNFFLAKCFEKLAIAGNQDFVEGEEGLKPEVE